VFVPGAIAFFLGRLASFSRLIMFDKRGPGLSDAVSGVGYALRFLRRGPMSILFSATYPEPVE
jgi:hypothetical protein